MEFSLVLSRFAYIFVIYAVITSGFVQEVLSCQMRYFLHNMYIPRHFFGILLIFMFIILEGGWSWDQEDNEAKPNDTSSANVIDTMQMAILLYAVFLISSKSQFIPNVIFFSLMFILYLVNTQRNYWMARKKISEETNQKLLNFEIGLFIVSIATLGYGFIDYILYQMNEYGDKFSWYIFLLGAKKCASLVNK
jgi:hypothetical protein